MQVFVAPEPGLATLTLTHKQQTVYEFIQRYMNEYRRSPLIREIQLGCQIMSYKSTIDRLNALEHKGFIRRIPNKHRGIKVVKKMLELLALSHPLPTVEKGVSQQAVL